MALIGSYALWNNKGGVGKSTISYHLSMRYAELNPDKNVLVIDLCPQANCSLMLLGGGTKGEECVVDYSSRAVPKTVVGYIGNVISSGRGARLPSYHEYLIKTKEHNNEMPNNLFLLCGDGNLEPMAPAINDAALMRALTPTAKPWKWIIEIIRNLIDDIAARSEKDWMVFVDTNPSFGIYTQMAVSAVDRLIVPINADDSSKTASSAMIALLRGTNPPHPIYGSWTYAETAKSLGVSVPKIHMLIGNRLAQFEGPAKAYGALSTATANALYEIYKEYPDYFTSRISEISSKEEFIEAYSVPLRDFNTVGIVCAHKGLMLSSVRQGYHTVYGEQVKVNTGRIRECRKAIDAVVNVL